MAKIYRGIVTSDKSDKTIAVNITTSKTHPIYRKQYSVSRRILAHDEKNEAKIGDKVSIVESRPISRQKSFRLSEIIERPLIREEQSVESVTAETDESTTNDEQDSQAPQKPKKAKKKTEAKK